MQSQLELVEGLGAAFRLDEHALAVVEHEAAEAEPLRQSVDERAEADALDDAGDADPPPFHGRIIALA